jgi:hypothetical protein
MTAAIIPEVIADSLTDTQSTRLQFVKVQSKSLKSSRVDAYAKNAYLEIGKVPSVTVWVVFIQLLCCLISPTVLVP